MDGGMTREPTVSVLIPSYNHEQWLPHTLDSIIGQTYRDIEVIVVDDGSTDDSLAVAKEYAARHPSFIKVFTHADGANLGISRTDNEAVRRSNGRYLMSLDSDDVLYEKTIELQVNTLESDPQIGLVYGLADVIDSDGRRISSGIGNDTSFDRMPIEALIQDNVIPAPTVMFRRQCIARLGAYNDNLISSDYELWLRISAHYKIKFIDKPLAMWRLHSYNASRGITDDFQFRIRLEALKSVLERASSIGGALAEPRIVSMLELEIAYWLKVLGESDQALALITSEKMSPNLTADFQFLVFWLARKELGPALWCLDKLEEASRNFPARPLKSQEQAYKSAIKAVEHYKKGEFLKSFPMLLKCLWYDASYTRMVKKLYVLFRCGLKSK